MCLNVPIDIRVSFLRGQCVYVRLYVGEWLYMYVYVCVYVIHISFYMFSNLQVGFMLSRRWVAMVFRELPGLPAICSTLGHTPLNICTVIWKWQRWFKKERKEKKTQHNNRKQLRNSVSSFRFRVQDFRALGYSKGQMKTIYFVERKLERVFVLFWFQFNDNIKFLLNFYHVCFLLYWIELMAEFVLGWLIKKMHFPACCVRNKEKRKVANNDKAYVCLAVCVCVCVFRLYIMCKSVKKTKPRRWLPGETNARSSIYNACLPLPSAHDFIHTVIPSSRKFVWYWRLSYSPITSGPRGFRVYYLIIGMWSRRFSYLLKTNWIRLVVMGLRLTLHIGERKESVLNFT